MCVGNKFADTKENNNKWKDNKNHEKKYNANNNITTSKKTKKIKMKIEKTDVKFSNDN